MVASGTHVNSGCCFDFGNAETSTDDNGHMDAVNLGTECYFPPCAGSGGYTPMHQEGAIVLGDDTGTDGAIADLWNCQSYAIDQHWYHNPDGSLTTLGRCLDIDGNGTAAGTKVELWTATASAARNGSSNPTAPCSTPQSGLCLDDPGGVAANGTQLQIWTCNGTPAQQFALS